MKIWDQDYCFKGSLILIWLLGICTLSFFLTKKLISFYQLKEKQSTLEKVFASENNELSEKNRKILHSSLKKEIACLKSLEESFFIYQEEGSHEEEIVNFSSFQANLQKDLSILLEKGAETEVTLPPHFFLGFTSTELLPRSSKELSFMEAQKKALFWLAEKIIEQPHLDLLQFTLEGVDAREEKNDIISLGNLKLKIKTEESSFQKIFHAITQSPHFFVIKNITVENSNPTPPTRTEDLRMSDEQTSLQRTKNLSPRITILLGQEKVIASITIELFKINNDYYKKLFSKLSSADEVQRSQEAKKTEHIDIYNASSIETTEQHSVQGGGRQAEWQAERERASQFSVEVELREKSQDETKNMLSTASPVLKKGTSLFISRHLFIQNSELHDLLDEKVPLYPPIPNQWLVDHHLDYSNPNILLEDTDHDGFSNLEEWLGNTTSTNKSNDSSDPSNPSSHPLLWTKLRYINDDIQKKNILLEFVDYEEENGKTIFQIQPKTPLPHLTAEGKKVISIKRRYASLGQKIEGLPFFIAGFEKKEELHHEVVYDVSKLILQHEITGEKLTLFKKSTLHPKATTFSSIEGVRLHYLLPKEAQIITLRCGDTFSLESLPLPPENKQAGRKSYEEYQLLKINKESLELQKEGTLYTLPMSLSLLSTYLP